MVSRPDEVAEFVIAAAESALGTER